MSDIDTIEEVQEHVAVIEELKTHIDSSDSHVCASENVEVVEHVVDVAVEVVNEVVTAEEQVVNEVVTAEEQVVNEVVTAEEQVEIDVKIEANNLVEEVNKKVEVVNEKKTLFSRLMWFFTK